MIVYLITIISSTFITYYAYKHIKERNAFFFFSAIAILIPCIIACLRAETIGSDTSGYPRVLFDLADESTSFSEYLNSTYGEWYALMNVRDVEPLFYLLAYVVAKTINSFQVLLFLIELLIVLPIYIAIYNCKEKIIPWFSFLTFMLMFFNVFLNAMRQGISLAFMLLAFSFLFKGKKRRYLYFILFLVIAILFHTSAVLSLLVFAFYLILHNKKERKYDEFKAKNFIDEGVSNSGLKIVLVVAIGFIIFYMMPTIVKVLNSMGLSYYAYYISGKIKFLPRQLILRLPILVFFFFYRRQMAADNKDAAFFLGLVFLDFCASQFASVEGNSVRVAWTFSIFAIISYSSLIHSIRKEEDSKILNYVMVFYLLVYWGYYIVITNVGETYPYAFFF